MATYYIVINPLLQYEGEPQGYTQALDYLNIFFTGIFALEFLFKIAAFRFKVSFFISLLSNERWKKDQFT